MKTREQELVVLLDMVFESSHEPDWAAVCDHCYLSRHNGAWLMTRLLRLMWLCNEDQAAFDEAIWILLNAAE